jgi:hypothetical protein
MNASTTRDKMPDDLRLRRLRGALGALERRFRLLDAARLVPWALVAALMVVLALAASMRIVGWPDLPWLGVMGVAIVLVSLCSALGFAFLRPRAAMTTALRADIRLGLDERLSTALEAAERPPTSPSASLATLRDAQLDDALHCLEGVVPSRDLPVVVNRRALVVPGVLVLLLVALLLVPSQTSQGTPSATNAQVAAEQQNIEVLEKAIEKSPNADDPALQKLLQELNALSQDLKEGDLTDEEALARLSDTEAELQKALDPQAPAQREALVQLSKQLAQSENSALKDASEALANDDPEKAAEQIAKAGDGVDKMTPDERKALAQELREARDKVASADPELAGRLNDAADALEGGDTQAAQDALRSLADQVQHTGNNLATQKQLEQALSQIQQSKQNIASAGQATPQVNGTVMAGPTSEANGTAVAASSSPVVSSGSPVTASGTAVALGSPAAGATTGAGTGTPVLAQGTPGQGTPVAGQGQGEGQNQSPGQGQGQGQGQSSGPPAGGWGKGHEEPVYVPPSSVQIGLTPVTVQGQDGQNGEQSTAPTNGDNNTTGQALTPYEDVYGEYEDQAGDALSSDYIPQGYKDLVRDYFSQIAPK